MRKILALLALLLATPAAAQNYSATAGSGLTFGAKSVTSVLYPYWIMCDATTITQCAAINASGQLSVQASIASGGVASGAYASGAFASGAIGSGAMVDLGAIADAAATAGSTGTLSAKLRLMTTQLGTLNTTLGTPFQAGGSIGNSSFGATQSGNWSLTTPNGDRAVAPTAITTAGTSSLTINTQGASMVQWSFSSFTTGTITFQLSDATGSAFNNTQCFIGSSPYTLAGSVTTTNGSWFCPTGGAAVAKIVMTGGSGTATVSANASSGDNLLAMIAGSQAAVPAGTALIGNVGTGVYPAGSTPITASATGTTTATTATLAANASLHTYICGFSIRANANAAATNNATVTGPITGTMNFTQWTAVNTSGLGVTEEVFSPCVISSAINTAIAVVSGAPGTGGVVSVSAWGFQL